MGIVKSIAIKMGSRYLFNRLILFPLDISSEFG
jgi:hypothetical protein